MTVTPDRDGLVQSREEDALQSQEGPPPTASELFNTNPEHSR